MRSITRELLTRLRSIEPRDTRQCLKIEESHVTTKLFMRKKINLYHFLGSQREEQGWTLHQICTMIIFTAESTGTSNATLDKFLKIFELVVDTKRNEADVDRLKNFPKSTRAVGRYLHLQPTNEQNVVYICPTRRPVPKRGVETRGSDLCGYTLTTMNAGANRTYSCDVCVTEWEKKEIEKDGNYFSCQTLQSLLGNAMKRYGKYCSVREDRAQDGLLRDVHDGERMKQMEVRNQDIIISIHADAAQISKSTDKKMYLMFVQIHNIPVRIRQSVWPLLLVWVGNALPRDREAFTVYLTQQLQIHQRESPESIAIS